MKNDCRAELDASYGLTHHELRYTPFGVDPKEVHGEDPSTGLRAGFPGETFRVLKEKEIKQIGDTHLHDLPSKSHAGASVAQDAMSRVRVVGWDGPRMKAEW